MPFNVLSRISVTLTSVTYMKRSEGHRLHLGGIGIPMLPSTGQIRQGRIAVKVPHTNFELGKTGFM